MKIKTFLAKLGKPKFRSTLAVMPRPRRILDIGVANNSYVECKTVFPSSVYHGLDYQNIDFSMMEGDSFFLCNLESDGALDGMQAVYDLIIVNHVLEHLRQGQAIFSKLCCLLESGGILYAEFPSIRTAYKRQVGQSYHFHEDPTHKAFYRLEDLANAAIVAGCNVVSCGPVSPPPPKVFKCFSACVLQSDNRAWFRTLPAADNSKYRPYYDYKTLIKIWVIMNIGKISAYFTNIGLLVLVQILQAARLPANNKGTDIHLK